MSTWAAALGSPVLPVSGPRGFLLLTVEEFAAC